MAIQTNFPAVKPSLLLDFANTKRLDPRITFTRTTTATYYDGVTTAKAEENLVLYSQGFDNAVWGALRLTVTANSTTAPDGTSTADTITQATGQTVEGGNLSQTFSVVAANYVLSLFAKPNGKNFLIIRETLLDGTLKNTWFNVSTGTVGTTAAGHTATITASTNGFYRCTIAFTVNAARSGTIYLNLADTDGSVTVVDSGGLYFWGAQLEQRSSVTAYTATTTQPITNYIPVLLTAASGVARFDHNPTTDESLGLLIEEQRTNLATYSADFSNAAWTKNASSITSNTIVAPDGTLTGDKAIANTSATEHFFEQTCSTNTNQSYTQTIYVKRGEESQFAMMVVAVGSSSTTSTAIFSISAGGVVTADGGIAGLISSYSATNVGNGWYRCSIVYTLNGTVTSHRMRIYPGSNSASAVGNNFNGSYFWGAQLEAGAFPTSYIATTAATVTRNADAASMTGSNFTSWYNAAEGAIYCESQTASFAQNQGIWAIGNPSLSFGSGNMMYAIYDSGVSGRITVSSYTNGSQQVGSLGVVVSQTANTFSKSAYVYKVNDFAQTTNAASVFADTSGTVPIGPTGLSIGGSSQGWSGASNPVNGTIKKIAYYPLRLTNANLQALTS